MRIKQILITNLFGMFDHTINLNLQENLTIIYGINGIGKTMIFRILDNFFSFNFIKLGNLPFDNLEILFENNNLFKINNQTNQFIIKYFSKEKKDDDIFDLSKYKTKKIKLKLGKVIENFFPVEKIGKNKFLFFPNNEILTIEQIIYQHSKKIPNSILKTLGIYEPDKLKKLVSEPNLYFIETQRLLKFDYDVNQHYHFSSSREKYKKRKIETVKNYSEELSKRIQKKRLKYSRLSEKFELSLGKRLMNKEIKVWDINQLREENKKLEEKRNQLKSVGLFEDLQNEENLIIPNDIDDLDKAILSVNIQDMKSKLKIFDDLYHKLKIFLDIINNKRFFYKKIYIHPQKGFIFKNIKKEKLKITELSSGEQHEIVLFYDLLFKVPENSLILIDEPEISLHIVWQKEFLNDMKEIIQIRNFDMLIATHSPQIINGNWDITVELEKQ